MGELEIPTVPRISYADILKRRKAILDIGSAYVGLSFGGQTFQQFATEAREALSFRSEAEDPYGHAADLDIGQAVEESVASFAKGQSLDRQTLVQMAARLAGNTDQLRLGRPVGTWQGQPYPEWVLLVVTYGERHVTKRGKVGGVLHFRTMSGSPAGLDFNQFFPDGVLARMAAEIGIKKKGRRPYVHPAEFGRAKLVGLLEPGAELKIGRFAIKDALKKQNYALLLSRTEDRDCPKAYSHPCHQCHIGYDSCPNGTHPRTYEWRRCANDRQKQHGGWFEPGDCEEVCLACRKRRPNGHGNC